MRKSISLGFAVLAVSLTAASVSAATINVASGGDINAAIGSANAGDTILLANGTYTQNIVVNKQVTIQAANTGAATITGNDPLGAVRTQADGIVLSGIVITGSNFMGISIENSGSLTLTNVNVNGNGTDLSGNNDSRSGLFFNGGVGAVTLNTTNSSFNQNGGRGLTLSGGTGNTLTWNATNTTINQNGEVGVLADCAVALNWNGVSVSSNTTSGYVSFYAATGTVTNSTINSNGNRGFELLPVAGQVNNVTFTSTTFNGNTSNGFILDQAGGGARPGQVFVWTNCNFNNNGGANPALFQQGTFTFNGGTINNNGEGLARFFWEQPAGSTFTIDGLTVTGNAGNGMRFDAAEPMNVTITNSTISGNGGEGPIQMLGNQTNTLAISRTTLGNGTGNLATAVLNGALTATLTNVLVNAGNSRGFWITSTDAGGPSITLDHCTVVGDGTVGKQAFLLRVDGTAATQNATATVNNSIVSGFDIGVDFDQIAGSGLPVKAGDYSLWFNSNSFQDGAANTNDLVASDPLFVSTSNFALQSSSPAVDSANPGSAVIVDLTGATRPVGVRNDRGAYEYSATSVSDWLMF